LLSGIILAYGAITRPDLKFKLFRFSDIPANYKWFVVIDDIKKEGNDTLILLGKTSERYNKDAKEDKFTVDIDFWSAKRGKKAINKILSFPFPDRPQSYAIDIESPNLMTTSLVPVAVAAADREYIRVLVYMIDENLDIQYESRIRIKYPEEALGSKINVTAGSITDPIGTKDGHQRCVAIGLSLSESPASHNEWLQSPHGEDDLEPAMQQKLGVIIAPAHQTEWSEPLDIIEFPSPGYVAYVKPYGHPALFVQSGGSANGWYTKPTADILAHPDKEYSKRQSELQTDNDTWKSYYLAGFNGHIWDRIRMSEHDSDRRWPYAVTTAFSAHTFQDKLTEFSLLSWPCKPDNFENILYSNYTVSDTSELWWKFEPDNFGETQIRYEHWIVQRTPFENSNNRLGFALVNDDSSAVLLMQPSEWWKPQEIVWDTSELFKSGAIPDLKIKSFLDVVPFDEDEDGYAFSTKDNRIVVFNEKGEIIHNREIKDHFTADNAAYEAIHTLQENSQCSANTSAKFLLVEPNAPYRCEIFPNKDFNPNWSGFLKVSWTLIIALWLFASAVVIKYTKEETYISEEDFIETVQEVQEDQETLLNSMIVHEIGNSISIMQSDIQIDYQWIIRMQKLLENDTIDIEKLRNILGNLKGQDAYIQIMSRTKEYLDTLEDTRLRDITLVDAMQKSLRFHHNLFVRNNIEIQKFYKNGSGKIHGGVTLIFANILRNAIEAISAQRQQSNNEYTGIIRIDIYKKGKVDYITFQDNGCPIMSPDSGALPITEWDSVFDAAFTTKKKNKGHGGLGLAVSRKFVNKLGWKLYVDNNTDEGFTKRFTLEIRGK
jgi:signal transduction histidine kinase